MGRHSAAPVRPELGDAADIAAPVGRMIGPITDPVLLDAIEQELTRSRTAVGASTAGPDAEPDVHWVETPFSGPVPVRSPPVAGTTASRSAPARAALAPPPPPRPATGRVPVQMPSVVPVDAPRIPVAPSGHTATSASLSSEPDRSPLERGPESVPDPVPLAAALRTDDDDVPRQDVGVSKESLLLGLGVGLGITVVLSVVAVLPI